MNCGNLGGRLRRKVENISEALLLRLKNGEMDLNKEDKSALESEEVEKLYQLYIRFQSDDKTALDEIFK